MFLAFLEYYTVVVPLVQIPDSVIPHGFQVHFSFSLFVLWIWLPV